MAKTKPAAAATAGDIASEIISAIGGNDEQQEVKMWLDTGLPELNKAISGRYDGGMPVGRIVEMFGPESSGKTAIATKVMAAAQQAGGIALFEDHENSFDAGQGQELGLSLEPGKWIYKQPPTFESSVDMAVKLARVVREKKLIADDAPIVAVFDSLASMVPESKLLDNKGNERDTDSYTMHDSLALAKCTSAAFPALNQFANRYNMLLLFLNQIREKPGVTHGDNTTTPGGKAPAFYASVRISLGREMLDNGKKGEDRIYLGQIVKAFVKKNKVSRPFERATWRFMFREDGSGFFDTVSSTLEHLKDIGKIEMSGAFYVWPADGKKYYLAQLAERVQREGLWSEVLALLPTT